MFGYWGLVLQVMLPIGLYWLLFSSFGANPLAGPRAGLYDYVAFWLLHHTGGGSGPGGPWWFYLPRLALYEALPLVLIAVSLAVMLARRLGGRSAPLGAPARRRQRLLLETRAAAAAVVRSPGSRYIQW